MSENLESPKSGTEVPCFEVETKTAIWTMRTRLEHRGAHRGDRSQTSQLFSMAAGDPNSSQSYMVSGHKPDEARPEVEWAGAEHEVNRQL